MDYIAGEVSAAAPESAQREAAEEQSRALPNSVLASIAAGGMAPSASMLGRRESLAPALQAKMQGAFGADFSNVEVYRSETAKSAGLLGVASGSRVALSPDVNLSSHAGQAVLGHELSHVVAQARGIGTQGRGIMETPGLERQAMIEGERAASGMRAFAGDGLSMNSAPTFSDGIRTIGGETLTPISPTTGAFGMGAPMQGKFFKPDEPAAKTESGAISKEERSEDTKSAIELMKEMDAAGASPEAKMRMLEMRDEAKRELLYNGQLGTHKSYASTQKAPSAPAKSTPVASASKASVSEPYRSLRFPEDEPEEEPEYDDLSARLALARMRRFLHKK